LQVFDIAQRVRRKVLVDGKSIISIIQVANRLGYAKIPKEQMISLYADLDKLPDHEQLILATGTQGEPFSGLTRLANNKHENLKIKKGDMVIISADPIPGNESYVNKVIDSLLKMGANVIYRQDNVHVSGHGSKEDLRLMMSLIKPTFFIPVHGEYRMMHAHCRVAQETGLPEKNTLIAENGDIITVQENRIFRSGKVPANPVMIDGKTIGDIEPSVIDERRRLSKEGIVNAVILGR
jgi:ribonuclease J